MALFAERDFRSMPKINQFVQLAPTEQYAGSELDKWLYRQMTNDLSNKDATWSEKAQISAAPLRSLATLRDLLESIMCSVADRGKIKQNDLFFLNLRLEAKSPGEKILAYRKDDGQENPDNIEFSIEELFFTAYSPATFLKDIEAQLIDELLRALKDRSTNRIRSCTVCHNPFVAGKRDQLICSYRDNTRLSMRRRRNRSDFVDIGRQIIHEM